VALTRVNGQGHCCSRTLRGPVSCHQASQSDQAVRSCTHEHFERRPAGASVQLFNDLHTDTVPHAGTSLQMTTEHTRDSEIESRGSPKAERSDPHSMPLNRMFEPGASAVATSHLDRPARCSGASIRPSACGIATWRDRTA